MFWGGCPEGLGGCSEVMRGLSGGFGEVIHREGRLSRGYEEAI